MSPMFHPCADCGGERLFEQQHEAPGTCPDAPGGLCLEWSCTECGGALMAASPAFTAGPARAPDMVGRVA